MDQEQLTGAVFIDLRKTFGTTDHSLPLSKLLALGITGQANNWFKDYLGSRTQVVGFQGVLSDSEPVNVVCLRDQYSGPPHVRATCERLARFSYPAQHTNICI